MSEKNLDVLESRGRLALAQILRPLIYIAMAVCFSVHLREFFSRSYVIRYDTDMGYLLLLGIYAAQREIRRWIQGPETLPSSMRGEFFVIGWWLFYWVTVAVANHVSLYRVPRDLLTLCLDLTAIYCATAASYALYNVLMEKGVSLPWADQKSMRTPVFERFGHHASAKSA